MTASRTIPIALVPFDAVPEAVGRNLQRLEELADQARANRAGREEILTHQLVVPNR